jgi:hypothetical protein
MAEAAGESYWGVSGDFACGDKQEKIRTAQEGSWLMADAAWGRAMAVAPLTAARTTKVSEKRMVSPSGSRLMGLEGDQRSVVVVVVARQ